MHNASFGDHMANWDRLAKTVASNASELSHLQRTREVLAQAQREAALARQRQAVARAAAQQATRDLEAAMAKAHEAATRLRSSLMGRYGRQSLKLIEFGMRPYPAARTRVAEMQRGELPQRVPEVRPPSATSAHEGETFPRPPALSVPVGEAFPIDARTRGAGARDLYALGNGSPTSRTNIPLRAAVDSGGTDGPPPVRRP